MSSEHIRTFEERIELGKRLFPSTFAPGQLEELLKARKYPVSKSKSYGVIWKEKLEQQKINENYQKENFDEVINSLPDIITKSIIETMDRGDDNIHVYIMNNSGCCWITQGGTIFFKPENRDKLIELIIKEFLKHDIYHNNVTGDVVTRDTCRYTFTP